MPWKTLRHSVEAIARAAGAQMLQAKDLVIHAKGEQDYVTEVDIAVNEYLISALGELFPQANFLAEESDSHFFSPTGYTWIIDPIDGTSNFIFDMQLSCVSIALLFENTSVLGIVYNPYTDEMFVGVQGEGAFLNDQPIAVNKIDTVKDSLILCETNPYGDRTTGITKRAIDRVFQRCVDYRVLGSAALDICYVACGRGSALLSQSLQPWDYAAGEIIVREAGGTTSRWDGSPLTFDTKQTYLASNQCIHDEMITLVGD